MRKSWAKKHGQQQFPGASGSTQADAVPPTWPRSAPRASTKGPDQFDPGAGKRGAPTERQTVIRWGLSAELASPPVSTISRRPEDTRGTKEIQLGSEP